MWWLDPGKEVLNVLFNRILAPYVENLDLNQVNYGIAQGQLTLRNLKLKRGVLDKFQLPVDVLEGHLGTFTLSLYWMNLGNQPVEIFIEDVYLLVIPSGQAIVTEEEEEARAQAAKAERLENAELLHMKGAAESNPESVQTQGLIQSLITKVINNVQVTVKNIHIRYEDSISVPGHPFAAGITLGGFTAVSVNDQWQPVFIESTAGAIHKLAKLESLAMYFDTDAQSMAGLPSKEAIKTFTEMIHDDGRWSHQYILKPVSGEGRIIVNHKIDRNTPRFNVELLFDDIGVSLDIDQYRNVISLIDMYHVYMRKHQYRKFQPSKEEIAQSPARARLRYAANAILAGVKDKNQKWTWNFFAQRRDDRNRYVELFQKKLLNPLTGDDLLDFEKLEKKLSYEDIRFYRSIARSRLRKNQELMKRIETEKQRQEGSKQGWGSWLWGTSSEKPKERPIFSGSMTEEQRRQLYDVLDYDEKSSLMETLQAPRDSLKMQVTAKLKRGSFALKTDPHGDCTEMISVVFDVFNANFIQRHGNFESTISLQDLRVFDGTTKNTLYPQIVRVKRDLDTVHTAVEGNGDIVIAGPDEPFFLVKFENNPLDDRADSALTVRMRHMEIIYFKGYVEAIYKFFKPPESQLESVEALLNVASQTLEGLRKDTRAGLEYALQTHKTIDVQVDMNAPVIIIPEDITTTQCTHLIVDAGHIAIESDLVDKKSIQEVHKKRNEKYTDEDYHTLESLMYDKLSLNLRDAQFVLGHNLEECQAALKSPQSDRLHLLERVSIGLQIQKSIVPSAVNLAQFKVLGKLPTLQLNLSDTKYRSLMRLIDVCIPKLQDESERGVARPSLPSKHSFRPAYTIPTGFFESTTQEYNVDEEDSDDDDENEGSDKEEFFEAENGPSEPQIHQGIFQLEFRVGVLRASIWKTNADGEENPLGDLALEDFALFFNLYKYHMSVDLTLRSISTDIIQPQNPIKLISTPSEASGSPNLLQVKYTRVQSDSPEYQPIYEGIDQSIDVKISTLVFRIAPEPILAFYDFIMTTFVPSSAGIEAPPNRAITSGPSQQQTGEITGTDNKLRILVKLESVKLILENESISLATLNLSVADVAVFIRGTTLRVSGRLGDLALTNDDSSFAILPKFNQLLSIEGQNFADFIYQTYDPHDESYSGIRSSIQLNAASLKFNFLEGPLQRIYVFLLKLARLKYLYDAATTVAVQTAADMDGTRFDISIKSPILIFPTNAVESDDALIMRLGHIEAKNSVELNASKISASLHGIKLDSLVHTHDISNNLTIIDNIDVDADIIQTSGIDREKDISHPDTQISVKISDVKLHITQRQYILLVQLSRSIPRVFSDSPATGNLPAVGNGTQTAHPNHAPVNLQPELRSSDVGSPTWTSLDLVVTVNVLKLHLYDETVVSEDQMKEHGIARFALNDNSLRLKQLADGSTEAQIILRSFTMSNTRPGPTKFREIIPAAQHERNQFMLLYTSSASYPATSLAVLTVDSPQIIFAVDPVFRLMQFFSSAFAGPERTEEEHLKGQTSPDSDNTSSQMDFRLDLHDVSLSVLENDSDGQTRAIRLQVGKILFSQQGITALNVQGLGMSLIQMGKIAESARFLDDVDVTISFDNRSSSAQQMTSIEIGAKPIVFRASYRDINLITSIVNRAIELYSESQGAGASTSNTVSGDSGTETRYRATSTTATTMGTNAGTVGRARVTMTKEQLKASFEGFRLILIGDMHEQPMLHLKVKPFIVGAKDWSGELQATTTLATQITYWNLTNSHWEPLIDPWTFTTSVSKDISTGSMNVAVTARERLDINLSTTFVELALTTLNTWSKEGAAVLKKPRGVYAPYRIRNRTGIPVFVWADTEGVSKSQEDAMVKISDNEVVDWRFGDWKTAREHVSSGQHMIGIQFLEQSWEPLRGIPVEREGEYVFSLRPRSEKFPTRVLFEVKVVDNTKIVTIRSTYKVENLTLYPLELMLVDEQGHPVNSVERIIPGQDYALPIVAVTKYKVRIQPDQGFGYKWSSPIRWEDLLSRKSFTIKCPHSDSKEAAFRLQAWAQMENNDLAAGKYPKINLRLRPPIELENLLPYNIEYRIYDKNTDQNWRSYLRKGGIMPIHSVELAHFILLNVAVQDSVFKPSEFAIINTDGHSDFDIEKRITLQDQQNRKLGLRLNYIRYPDSGGAFKVQVYSPYIVINKTGLPFSMRSTRSTRTGLQDVAGDSRPETTGTPSPFLLSHSQPDGHEFTFQFGDSAWSKIVSFEAPAAETEVSVAIRRNSPDQIFAGISWSEGQGKYKLTKVIALTPRFLVRNHLPYPIVVREHGVVPRERCVIPPGERAPLRVFCSEEEKMLTIAYSGLNAQWSPQISLEAIGSVFVRLNREGNVDLIQAELIMEGSTIFVLLSQSEEWPFEIENDTDCSFELRQKDAIREPSKEQQVYSVPAHSKVRYAWDFPAAKEKRLVLMRNGSRRVVDIMEIGDLIPFKFVNNPPRSRTVSLDVRASGQKQILRISNYIAEQSLYRPKPRVSSTNITRQDTLSSTEGFEAITETVTPILSFKLDLAGIGLSLINKRLVEVVYLTIDNMKIEYTDSTNAQAVILTLGSLQVDNQLHDALFPVILQPTPLGKDTDIGALPTIQTSVIWLKDQAHGVLFVKYCSVLIQALTIEADEDLLFAIYDLTQIRGASWELDTQDILIGSNLDDILDPTSSSIGQELYFEVLELQPIMLALSFMRTERVSSEEKLSIRNPLAVIVNALTMTVGNVNDAPLEMNALAIKDMRLSTSELQNRIFYHYRQEVLRQLYRILGSADFIGNPVGLFTNVSSGVADIFYEPFQGVVMHGNRELGIGIAKGAASFVKKTVFGVSDSLTKFTSSVGKGLSAATFDSEYQARRRMTQRRNRPRHAIYGVAAGGEAFASSVTSAMEGVFMKPIEGAEAGGALGFFKGVGKGLVGAVTKPVVGVFDLASNVSEGIRNTTTVFDSPERDRVRMPRLSPADGVLKSYSAREALGQHWMRDLNNGAYRKENYVAHINSPTGDNVVLLTQTKLLSFYSRKLRLDWELPFTQIQGVTAEDGGIRFAHRLGREHDKFAVIPDKASQSWFFNQVATVVRSFNARRRMDA
ncbi:vacuolar protein sorting-associated protein vps13 [Coprinopsis marcescibilis]|uniref:Vacuolar protein sorting-associated protein vps13 n=1 Tax=Coprinopsis marcescibilis TaxID=230819 RepID=A0A5C3LCT9_COPMA|nr:vacuolar protein sorting-associated protein vps13 [Coprinopsis marcescibilis]